MHQGVIGGWHTQCVKERSSCAHVELRQVILGVHGARGAAGSKEPQGLGPSLLLACFGTRDKSRACATGAERIPSQHQKFPPWKVATGRDGVGEAACALLAGRELGNAGAVSATASAAHITCFFGNPHFQQSAQRAPSKQTARRGNPRAGNRPRERRVCSAPLLPVPAAWGTDASPSSNPGCFLQCVPSTLITGKKNACASSYCVVVKND